MSIMSVFQGLMGSAPAAPAATPPVPAGVAAAPGVTPAGTPPAPTATDPAALQAGRAEGGESPLANFSKLWENDPNAKEPAAPNLDFKFSVDPKKVQEAIGALNFTGAVAPETVQKALGGDAAALSEALNAVAQATMMQSTSTTAKMVEAALAKQAAALQELLPSMVREHAVKNQIRADNPIFSNPAVAPMMEMLETTLASKHPQATPQEVSQTAKQFVEALAAAITPQNKQPAATQGGSQGKTLDWSAWLQNGGSGT